MGNLKEYLESSTYIDWQHPKIVDTAQAIAQKGKGKVQIASACFEFVRDEIKHSWDYQLNPVTCRASDVLEQRTGYCFAKSHLLAALLRANQIPAGLCYQRLATGDDASPYCLHGLNAVYLEAYGWYRIDARGNKPGVAAAFSPPLEKLAFLIGVEGEADLPEIWAEPIPVVVHCLETCQTFQEVSANLPDIQIIKASGFASVDRVVVPS